MDSMSLPKLLTEAEVAGMLRISRKKVQTLLPRVRLSARGTRYDLRDVEALIANAKVTPSMPRP